MRIVSHHLPHGSNFVLPQYPASPDESDALIVIVGGGRGCVFKAKESLAGVWIPLHGRLQHGAGGSETSLSPGEMRVTEGESNLIASGRGNSLWVAILGSRTVWRNLLAGFGELPPSDPPLMPAIHMADHAVRRCAIGLVRALTDGTADVSVDAMLDHIVSRQKDLDIAVRRCPGRTHAQRRQVFLRLQRVRNYLASNCHLEVDNDTLARMASYSPWHFIRAFRAAYEQTPRAYLVEQRLWRARRLLRTSPLAIAEIALASGFENRCAFSRLFRQRFGATAGTLRREDSMRSATQEQAIR